MSRSKKSFCVETEVDYADLDLAETMQGMYDECCGTEEFLQSCFEACQPNLLDIMQVYNGHGAESDPTAGGLIVEMMQELIDNGDVTGDEALRTIIDADDNSPVSEEAAAELLREKFSRAEIISIVRKAIKGEVR